MYIQRPLPVCLRSGVFRHMVGTEPGGIRDMRFASLGRELARTLVMPSACSCNGGGKACLCLCRRLRRQDHRQTEALHMAGVESNVREVGSSLTFGRFARAQRQSGGEMVGEIAVGFGRAQGFRVAPDGFSEADQDSSNLAAE